MSISRWSLKLNIHRKYTKILLDIPPAQQQYNLARDRARRQIRPPQRYAHAEIVSFALSVAEEIERQDPITFHEAIISNEFAQWIVAMNEELESLYKNHTWELVKPPKG